MDKPSPTNSTSAGNDHDISGEPATEGKVLDEEDDYNPIKQGDELLPSEHLKRGLQARHLQMIAIGKSVYLQMEILSLSNDCFFPERRHNNCSQIAFFSK
jgi:hypothetical protein